MASFDWKVMQVFVLGKDFINLHTALFDEVKNDPAFFQLPGETLKHDELQRRSVQKAFKYFDIQKKMRNDQNTDVFSGAWLTFITFVDKEAGIQQGIFNSMFLNAILGMGSERHLEYEKKIKDGKIVGAFCLTEIEHGSNTKRIQTEAVYDKNTREFVLKTPNFGAAKCWSGNVGRFATHVILYAQLIIPGEGNYGLHGFIVPIRDARTLLPYPGITIAHMGEKIGLQQIDNAVLLFNNYRIRKENLLNKLGDVNEKGHYVLQITDQRMHYAISLGVLTNGRISITLSSAWNLTFSLLTTMRYFNNAKIDTHGSAMHIRLIPYLAVVYVTIFLARFIGQIQKKFILMADNGEGNITEMGMELHAVSSAAKPVFTWLARDGIQSCFEACSLHAYHKASGLDKLKRNYEANCTYEGDNTVLIQQTSNWLIKLWPSVLKGQITTYPLSSIPILDADTLCSEFMVSSIEEFAQPCNLLKCYRWLIMHLLKKCYDKNAYNLQKGKLNNFWAKNDNQVYFCKDLSIAFGEHYAVQVMDLEIKKCDNDKIRIVLKKLLTLYAVWSLQKHIHLFYEGGYAKDARLAEFVETTILRLCNELRCEQMALINSIAPPDVVDNSFLWHADGKIYERMEAAIFQRSGVFSKTEWNIEAWSLDKNVKSKL